MRLRRPCEHDRYEEHSTYLETVGAALSHYHNCPGGEFLPEDAVVIEKVGGEWPGSATNAIYEVLAEGLDNERDRLYLADIPTTYILDALAALAGQVGEPGNV